MTVEPKGWQSVPRLMVVSADVDPVVNLQQVSYPMSGGGGKSSSYEGDMGEPGS